MMRNIDAKFKKPYNNCNLRKIIYHQYLPMFMSIFNLMGAQTDRFRYEVFQNLFLSPMNTVFLRDAVATVLTVYGIETLQSFIHRLNDLRVVATVLTVYGIETIKSRLLSVKNYILLQQYLPFTVLKLIAYDSHMAISTC